MEDYNSLLLLLSQKLTRDNLRDLIFFCKDVFPESEAEDVKTGTDLFRQLQYRDKLSSGNYEFLRRGLKQVGRDDLATLLPNPLDLHLSRLELDQNSLFGVASSVTDLEDSSLCRYRYNTCKNARYSPEISSRILLKKVSDRLRKKDCQGLVYICSVEGCLSTSCTERIERGTELFAMLEKKKLIGPNNYDFLCTCLQAIGRNDLCKLIALPRELPPALPYGLMRTQLLSVKTGMLSSKQNHFTHNWEWLGVVTKGDWLQISRMLAPLIKMCSAYDIQNASVVGSICTLESNLQTVSVAKNVDSLVKTSLENIFGCLRLHTGGLLHMHDSNRLRIVDVNLLEQRFKKCHEHIREFDEAVENMKWNPDIRFKIHGVKDRRSTPIGSSARNACNIIYELCEEFFGTENVKQELKLTDQRIFTIESGYYIYCSEFVMIQWLLTLASLLSSSSFFDQEKLCIVLVEIITRHREQIQTVYPLLAEIIGQDILKKLLEIANIAIDIEILRFGDTNGCTSPNNYFLSFNLLFYAFLFQLLSLAVLKKGTLSLIDFCTRLKHHHAQLYETESYSKGIVEVVRQAAIVYQIHVTEFRNVAIRSNGLCAPIVQELARI